MEISGSNFSETDASNNNASPNGAPEGMSPAGVNDTIRAVMGAVKRFWGRIQGANASTGSSNAYVVSPTVDLAAYVTGERYSFRANFANTGSATVNISSLGAKTIKYNGGAGKASLQGGEIQSGQPVTVEYDGTDMILVTPGAPDEGSWTPVLAGSTTAGTQTYAASGQVGRYIRQGNLVTFWGRVIMTAKDAATAGNLLITGLPFTASNITLNFAVSVIPNNIDFSTGKTQVCAFVVLNTSTVSLLQAGDNAALANLTATNLTDTTDVYVAGSYRIG